jgi:hypothetical protein
MSRGIRDLWFSGKSGMLGYAAGSGSEASSRDATGIALMTETVARPPVAKPAPRPRSRRPRQSARRRLAPHLDCSRAYIGKPETEGVIQRQGQRLPARCLADALHPASAHRACEVTKRWEKKQLVTKADYDAKIVEFAGVVLTALSWLPARRGDLGPARHRAVRPRGCALRSPRSALRWPTRASRRTASKADGWRPPNCPTTWRQIVVLSGS